MRKRLNIRWKLTLWYGGVLASVPSTGAKNLAVAAKTELLGGVYAG